MSFHKYKLEHYSKDSSGSYESTAVELSNIISVSVSLGLGEVADSFSFSMVNSSNSKFEAIKIDDRVVVSGSVDGGSSYTKLIDGMVNGKKVSNSVSNKIITFSGLNRLEKLFNALVATTGEPVQKPASYWIENIIDQVNDFNSKGGTNRNILYSSSTITQLSSSYNVSFSRNYEKAFKLIEELSRPEMTDGKAYIYYLDEDNYFHWEPQPETVGSTLEYGVEVLSDKTEKGMYDVVNYIIMNAGKSPYGASVLQMDYDVESINKYGWKVKLVTQEDIANELYSADRRSKPSFWSDDNSFPTSYPYITIWGESTSSDSDYNSKFVDKVLLVAAGRISGLLSKTAGASFRSTVSLSPLLSYTLGDLHQLKIPATGWSSPYTLRVNIINYVFNTSGWVVSVKFKEDEEFVRDV